jgi:hypothetical protein
VALCAGVLIDGLWWVAVLSLDAEVWWAAWPGLLPVGVPVCCCESSPLTLLSVWPCAVLADAVAPRSAVGAVAVLAALGSKVWAALACAGAFGLNGVAATGWIALAATTIGCPAEAEAKSAVGG